MIVGLAASALTLGVAPSLMPDDYSWVANTTSESAAQGVSGAWLARLGMLLFGASVLLCTTASATAWRRSAVVLHASFGVLMVAGAVFSSRSWRAGAPFDRTEDALHSFAATAMGFAFAFGVVAVLLESDGSHRWSRGIGVVAVVASVVLPIGMAVWSEKRGLLQRTMFAIAYGWYATEAVHRARRGRAAPV